MLYAFANDLFQRVVSCDKLVQRRLLKEQFLRADVPRRGKVLDFGCGTGLLARVPLRLGMDYLGYDVDPRLLDLARHFYSQGRFTDSWEEVKTSGPFDAIVAHCCFHHIADERLYHELQRMRQILRPEGWLLLADISLESPGTTGALRRLFLLLEKGAYLRKTDSLVSFLREGFIVEHVDIVDLPLLPGMNRWVASRLLIAEGRVSSSPVRMS